MRIYSSTGQVNYQQSGQGGVPLAINAQSAEYAWPDPFPQLLSPYAGLSFPTSTRIKLQARKENFSATMLGSTTHIYTSPLYEDMQALAEYFADWGCTYELQEGPTHVMTVQTPWATITDEDWWITNYASEQWELVPNNESKDILLTGVLGSSFVYPTQLNNTVILPDVLKVAVQRAYDNKANFVALQSGSSVPSASFIPYAQMILDYKRFGIDSVPSYTQTLRRSAVIDSRNVNRAFQTLLDEQQATFRSTTGTINFVMSTPEIISGFQIPPQVTQFLLPSYRKFISVNSNLTTPVKYETFAGWLIKPPTYNFISRFKVQVQQEFVWNEWIDHLYYIWTFDPETYFPLVNVQAATNPPVLTPSIGING